MDNLELALSRLGTAENLTPAKLVALFRGMADLLELQTGSNIALVSTFLHEHEIEAGGLVPTITFSVARADVRQPD